MLSCNDPAGRQHLRFHQTSLIASDGEGFLRQRFVHLLHRCSSGLLPPGLG